jgi:SAM-dependent methyltransferase
VTDDRRSVVFDRAADYYDATRGGSPAGERAMVDLLVRELGGRGLTLELGVGTGLVGLPLHAAEIPLVGLDLSRPMMDRLVEKAGGRSPFPLVQGDATRMPFADRVFGATYLRWVLHLILEWERALAEAVRVVRAGGVLAISMGAFTGPWAEIQLRFGELANVSIEPAGLMWGRYDLLDEAMVGLGATPRELPSITERENESLDQWIDGIARNRYSWTWKVEDPELLASVAAEVRAWAEERFGPLDGPRGTFDIIWRVYDLPS